MKEIRFLVKELAAATLTSLWWVAIIFKNGPFIIAAVVSSIVVISMGAVYVCNHWDE